MASYIEDVLSSGAPISSGVTATTDKYYIAQIHGLRTYNLSTLYVDYTHLMNWEHNVLATAVATHYYRFLPFMIRALHHTIAKYEPRYFREHRQPAVSYTHLTLPTKRIV